MLSRRDLIYLRKLWSHFDHRRYKERTSPSTSTRKANQYAKTISKPNFCCPRYRSRTVLWPLFGILCSDELRVTSPCLHFGRHAKRIRYRVRSILTFMVGGKFEPRYDQILSYFYLPTTGLRNVRDQTKTSV